MEKHSKIYVAGASGMVGSAVVRELEKQGYTNILTDRIDLTVQNEVNEYFFVHKPEYVFLVAGKVGGIKANNTQKGDFIYKNIMIAANVIHAAYQWGEVKKLLYTGSSCIYPKNSKQPISEDQLLTGELEPTNDAYAIAKIAGIKLCQSYHEQYGCNFISAMPTNCYGEGDNYDLENSHVVPALIRKIITAKKNNLPSVEVWGTGKAQREFLYVDDLANALVFLMNSYNDSEIINIGSGEEYTIRQLAELIKYFVKYEGELIFNGALDGMQKKYLDSLKLHKLGWKAKTSLSTGLYKTINNIDTLKWEHPQLISSTTVGG